MSNDMKMNVLSPENAKKVLTHCMQEREPVMLWGPPGVGKSSIVQQAAAKLKREVRDIRASQLDPVDLRGLPSIDKDGNTTWHTPQFFPKNADSTAIIFFDELPQAEKQTLNASLQAIHDRRIGEYRYPEGVSVVAAGNRVQDGTHSQKLSKAVASRFVTHIEVEHSLDDFINFGLEHGIHPSILAFVRHRPDLLMDFDPRADSNSFPCPRTWHKLSAFLGKLEPEIEMAFIAGSVGEGAGAEFTSFLKLSRSLPDLDEIVRSPDTIDVPRDPATLYALCGSMAHMVKKDNADRVFRFMRRISTEFQAVWIRDAVRVTPSITDTKEFGQWAVENGDLLL